MYTGSPLVMQIPLMSYLVTLFKKYLHIHTSAAASGPPVTQFLGSEKTHVL